MTISVIVCAHNEERFIAACLHSLLAQSRPPDEIILINNASTDRTGSGRPRDSGVRVDRRAAQGPGGGARARPAGSARRSARVCRCRLPRAADVAGAHRAALRARRRLLALSGNYRFYDWDWWGRTLLRAYDFTLGPATHVLVKYILRIGVVFYGGNFAVRRDGARAHRRLRHDDRVSRRGHQPRPAAVARRQRRAALRLLSLYVGAPLQRDGEGRGVSPLRAQLRVGTSSSPPKGYGSSRRAPLDVALLRCDRHAVLSSDLATLLIDQGGVVET